MEMLDLGYSRVARRRFDTTCMISGSGKETKERYFFQTPYIILSVGA